MTADELRRAQQRTADAQLARRQEIDQAARAATEARPVGGGPFAVGDRVLDTVSGREGTVESVAAPLRQGSDLVTVRVDGDGIVIRRPGELVARPRRPVARP